VIRAFPAADAPAVYDRSPSTPTPAPATPTPVPATPPPLRDVPYRITIPKIGVNAPVATYGLDANGVPEVPLNKYDVAWYNFSSEPGAGGNAVFAGHVTWNGAAVFYNLDKLAAGDEVLLEGNDGTKLRYTVKEVFLVDPDDPGSVAVMGPTPTDTITLITCGGQPFYIGGTFRYDYTHRLVVRGALAQVERPSSGAGG
jgi:LPXTG-site transpeptidase (sortase) family protein